MFCFSPWDCSNSSLQLGQPWELGREEIGCLSAFCLKDGWTGWIFLFMFAKFLIWSQRSPLPESLPALHLHSVLRVHIWPQKQQWLKDGRGCSEFTDLCITQWWLETWCFGLAEPEHQVLFKDLNFETIISGLSILYLRCSGLVFLGFFWTLQRII